jgi:uncharacterized iron-regulated membrane protein
VRKLHTYIGLIAGVYVLMMSLSGCVLVFYKELYKALEPQPLVVVNGDRLNRTQLKQAALRAHPNYEVSWIWERSEAAGPVEIWMANSHSRIERLFDPFSGKEFGAAIPVSIRALNGIKELHGTLASGITGRIVNAVGALGLLCLGVSGASMLGKRLMRRVFRGHYLRKAPHQAAGFWAMPFVMMWGATGMVLALEPFAHLIKAPAGLTTISYSLHAGAFPWWPMRAVPVIFGLATTLLFVTGTAAWWKRTRRSGRVI